MAIASGAVRLIQITDTHLFASTQGELLGVNTQGSLNGVLKQLLADGGGWDSLLLTGDLVHDGSAAGYQRLYDMVQPLGTPVYMIPGNHDDPKMLGAHFAGTFVQHHKAFSIHNWHFILLNSHADGEVGGILATSELEFLEQQLAANQDKYCFVAMHHPPVDVGSAWLDAIGLHNRRAFDDIVQRYENVRVILFGHVHQEFDRMQQKLRYLGSPSTCIQFQPGQKKFTLDRVPPAYRWICCNPDGTIDSKVRRDSDYIDQVDMRATQY